MVTGNQESNQVQEVNVSRTASRPVPIGERAQGPERMLPVLRLNLTGMSPLAVRPAGELAKEKRTEARPVPHIRISLYDGAIKLNGQKVNVPIGLSQITGKEFKHLFNVYQGNTLFVRRNGGLQRIRDSETVELVHGAEFTERRERPAIRSVSPYHRD